MMFQMISFDERIRMPVHITCARYVRNGHCTMCFCFFHLLYGGTIPCWWYVSAVLFICDGRIGLCCVYMVFLVTYPYEGGGRV